MNLRRTKPKGQETPKQNNPLKVLRKKVVIQAVIAVQTIIITVALIFGMSTAWYTNVLQSSGLQFEAEAWGFTGQVHVTQEPIEAGPGDAGSIGLTVTNMSQEAVDVALNVSKGQMSGEMQKRLFFYVDTQMTRAGEAMERVYINTRDSYTYSVLGYKELVLTAERSNDAALKWHWVYDMLGYYFLGTVTQDAGNQTVSANVSDYLRPVEYDLDKALFRDGLLESVDGTPVAELISQLSQTDGYENDLVATDMPGYYMVDVDDTGYGVWVYLCNWAQIQQATTYDSNLGKAAADAILAQGDRESFIARLTVIGQVKNVQTLPVSTAEQLLAGLESGGVVTLQNDLTLTQPLAVPSGTKAMLALGGHTITGPRNASVVKVEAGADLTIVDGIIDNANSTVEAISVNGGALTLQDVDVLGKQGDAIYVTDANGTETSRIRIFDSRLSADECAVYLRGNGTKSPGRTQIFVENSNLTSEYIAIMGNGSTTYWGTEVHVYRSNLTGYYAAIYQPQSDSLTRVVESTLTGICGMAVKGGDVEIVDSTVHGTGEKQTPVQEGSGYTDTGDAIYVDCSYNVPITLTVSGDSRIFSDHSLAIQVFEPNGAYAQITVTGGEYSSDVSAWLPEGYRFVDGKVTQGGSGDE